jgi:hypothetical protein
MDLISLPGLLGGTYRLPPDKSFACCMEIGLKSPDIKLFSLTPNNLIPTRLQQKFQIDKTMLLRILVVIAMSVLFSLGISSHSFAQAWYNSNWQYRKVITIDHTKVPNTDQSNFPVLVSLSSDPDLIAHARNDGWDILFTSSNGTTKINYEREKYSSGTLVAWVSVSTLSHTTDNVIYMYYGYPSSTDQQAASSTLWDANYKAVWHMKEATGANLADATTTGWTETPVNSPVQTASQIGGGLSFNGTSQYINHTYNTSSPFRYGSAITYSFWANMPGGGGGWVMGVSCSGGQGYGGVAVYLNSLSFGWTSTNTGSDNSITSTALSITANQWAYIVVALDITNRVRHFYINGVEVSTSFYYPSSNWTPVTSYNNSLNDEIGSRMINSAQYYFNGKLDEVRVSNIVRSADWITTEYNNQSSPSTFYSVSLEENCTSSITGTITHVTCYGGNNGAVSITVTGNTAPFTYVWSTGVTTKDINSLMAGTYTVTVTTTGGCSSLPTGFVVNQPNQVTATVSATQNVRCNGGSDGKITVTAGGGTPDYYFSVDNGSTWFPSSGPGIPGPHEFTELNATTIYKIKVKDSNGCLSPAIP